MQSLEERILFMKGFLVKLEELDVQCPCEKHSNYVRIWRAGIADLEEGPSNGTSDNNTSEGD